MLILLIVYSFYGYALIGLLFSVYFVGWGAAHLDTSAQSLPFSLRLLLLPGALALWPYFLIKLTR